MPKLIAFGVLCVILLIIGMILFDIETIEGNQLGVVETWRSGVLPDPYPPATYLLWLGFAYDVYPYDMSSQVYVMNDRPGSSSKTGVSGDEYGFGREKDAYLVQSKEGQDMTISMNVRWRLDPEKIVEVHRKTRGDVEEKLIRPTLMRVVKDKATQMAAISAYSGEGLVTLQQDIQTALEGSELSERGVIIENFVIEQIALDDEYIGEIKEKQVAIQRELKARQQELAALAEAQRAKAEARADYERTVVEAERDKQVGILKAEEQAQQKVLAAEAAKQQVVLAAEAEKEAGELKAAAILALGEAEAEAQKQQLSAYAVPGADAFVKIEVAKHMASAFQNIKGYLPENMRINVLGESFNGAVKGVVELNQEEVKP